MPLIDPTTLPGWDPTWTFFAPGAAVSWDLHFWTGEYDGWEPRAAWQRTVAVATAAEQLGFESLWVFDHVQTVPVPTDAPFSDKEWDPADVGGFHAALKGYNVPGVFYGHTHGRSVWRWDGAAALPGKEQLTDAELETGDRVVYDVFNCDNSATPHGGQQAFFYVELSSEGLTVREYSTKDAWKTGFWSPLVWRRAGVGAAAAS